jgi:hypothetical protein
MSEQCGCGGPLLTRPGDLEPTCGQCHSLPGHCDCEPVLPPLEQLLGDLAGVDDRGRRRRVHQVIRLLASTPAEVQQDYRARIIDAGHISRGDWREALAEAKRARPRDHARQPTAQDGGEPGPKDALDITDEPDAVREITAAMSAGALPEVYLRGRQLVHIGVIDEYAETRDLDEALLRRLIADHLTCTRQTPFGVRGALPYPNTCKAILALMDWPKVPSLRGVASYPLLLPDGTVLQQPGYDQASGLYLHQSMTLRPVPEKPTTQEITAARAFLLDKYLRDFPWTSPADKANYLAALLTPPLREVIADLFPLVYVTAPERGTGKSLLTELLTIVYGGAIRAFPENDGEMRKVITATLRGAEAVIVFDNVDRVVKSAPLAAVLTARTWTDRILGGSRDGKWPNDRLWTLTGTNVTLGGDHAQRSVRVAIDYGRPDPDLRKGFAIPDIAQWTQANRGQVIQAALILARAWQVAGAPETDHVMRGFTRWARIIGGILAHHEIPGFLANREETQVHDEDYAEWDRFLHMLLSLYGEKPQLARGILADAAANQTLADAMPSTSDGGPWTRRTLGKALAAHQGRWYDGLSLRSEEDKSAKIQRWIVRKLPSS